jgi:hypothetical protein
MEPLYIECHLFDRQEDQKVIIYRITEERVMDHTLYVLKATVDDGTSDKPIWKACGSYHYFDQVVNEIYRLLSKMEEEKGFAAPDMATDFLAFITNKVEEKSSYIFVLGRPKQKALLPQRAAEHEWIDFSTMKEMSKI